MNKLWDSKALAQLLVAAIKQNTLDGFDKDGKPFKPYSTRPFAMPYAAVVNKVKLKKLEKEGKKKGEPNSKVKHIIHKKTGSP